MIFNNNNARYNKSVFSVITNHGFQINWQEDPDDFYQKWKKVKLLQKNLPKQVSKNFGYFDDFYKNLNFVQNNTKDIVEDKYLQNAYTILNSPFYIIKSYDSFFNITLGPNSFYLYPQTEAEWKSCENFDDINKYKIQIKKIKNVKLSKYSEILVNNYNEIEKIIKFQKNIDLSGNYFIINVWESAYWHSVVEQIGTFLFLKKFITDLQLLMLMPCKKHSCCLDLQQHSPFSGFGYSEIINMISSVFPGDVVNLCINRYEHINIENIFFFYNIQYDASSLDNTFQVIYNKYLKPNVFTEIANLFDQFYGISKKFKKIFIYSQKSLDYDLILQEDDTNTIAGGVIHKLKSLGIFSDEEISKMIEDRKFLFQQTSDININGFNPSCDEFVRYITPKEKDKLFNFFKKYNYEIINLDNINFNDQINLFRSSTHIACFSGSYALSAMYAGSNTNMIIISLDTRYAFLHSYYAESVQNNVLKAMPNTSFEMRKPYYVEEVLDYIKKHEDIL